MREVKNEDELAGLAQWVVIRTASQVVCERDRQGFWHAMGSEHAVTWSDEDFPAQVLWSYADEIAPPLDLSKYTSPYTGILQGGGISTAQQAASS